jgi:hypothetical protein
MLLLLNKNAANSSLPTFRSFAGLQMEASGTIGGENHLTGRFQSRIPPTPFCSWNKPCSRSILATFTHRT